MSYQQIADPCKKCGSPHIEAGYGLAGGGMGVYFYCCDCGATQDKFQDPEAEPRAGEAQKEGEND